MQLREIKEFIQGLLRTLELHEAEIQVLALAKELNGIAIIDDSLTRQVARVYKIEARGTVYLLLRLYYKRKDFERTGNESNR